MKRKDDLYPPILGEPAGPTERIDEYQVPVEAVTQYITNIEAALPWATATTWADLTLLNGWTLAVAGEHAQYQRTPQFGSYGGMVNLRGRVVNGGSRGTGNAFPIAVLPAGFRPTRITVIPVMANAYQAGVITYVEIDTAGNIYYQGTLVTAGTGTLDLTGVSFAI